LQALIAYPAGYPLLITDIKKYLYIIFNNFFLKLYTAIECLALEKRESPARHNARRASAGYDRMLVLRDTDAEFPAGRIRRCGIVTDTYRKVVGAFLCWSSGDDACGSQ
jgi:hypothetical protein